jgi:hypothetical protein
MKGGAVYLCKMVTEDEKKFIDYWEANRVHQKKFLTQLIAGIPMGLLFALPVFLLLFSARFWFKRADMIANTQLDPVTISLAIFIIAVFFGVFNKKHQWDMKEQQYLEFKAKEKQQEQ